MKGHAYNKSYFISESKRLHGENKYNYSKVICNSYADKVILICEHHDTPIEFSVRAENHISPSKLYGCKYCSGYRNNVETIINKSKLIYGDKFDYSKLEYISHSKKITLICKDHSEPIEFNAILNNHINNKQGCPHCTKRPIYNKQIFIEKAEGIYLSSSRKPLPRRFGRQGMN
jgi:hypothetical protein